MNFESLPDELYLFIFPYLHKLDLLFSFTNLNQRFEQMLQPYLYEIDLTDHSTISYRQFRSFYLNIFPLYAHQMQSFKLSGYEQVRLFKPSIPQLTDLKRLSIETKTWGNHANYQAELDDFLTVALSSIESLRELSITSDALHSVPSISEVAQNLTALTFTCYDELWMRSISIMPMTSLKSLTIDCESIRNLSGLLDATPNLEEFNLFINKFASRKDCANMIKAPKNLRKLVLKVDRYRKPRQQSPLNLEMIKTFLSFFQNEVRHLTLIVLNTGKQFSRFDQLQSLVQDFIQLETFDYYIRTDYQPRLSDMESFPYIQRFPDSSYSLSNIIYRRSLPASEQIEQYLDSSLTMKDLYNCHSLSAQWFPETIELDFSDSNFKLDNLRTIELDASYDESYRFMKNIISHSPNLRCLESSMPVNTNDIINQLRQIFSNERRKHMIDLQLWITIEEQPNFHSTFWLELPDVLPNLRKLRLLCDSKFLYKYASTLIEFILMIRTLFPKLTRLEIRTQYFYRDTMEIQDENLRKSLANFQREFDENSQRHSGERFLYNCTERQDSRNHAWFDIWL